ncbi:MAG: polyphosphate kinase 1 [Synergistales bacterium]|nr:polyphosphate kinase 1 [Synergistales bacterium]
MTDGQTAESRQQEEEQTRDTDLDAYELYFNRELNWIDFDVKVLEEALDETNPLLERVRFLSIFFNNLDEFFMIRVGGLKAQLVGGVLDTPPDGRTPLEQLSEIREKLQPYLHQASDCWHNRLMPALDRNGIKLKDLNTMTAEERDCLARYFEREVYPVLTPQAIDPGRPFPHISNLSLNLLVLLEDEEGIRHYARVKVPKNILRLVTVPCDTRNGNEGTDDLRQQPEKEFIWLEHLLRHNLQTLFPGLQVLRAVSFRVTRNADVEIVEDEADDLLSAVEEGIGQRFFGCAVRLEVEQSIQKQDLDFLVGRLQVTPYQVYMEPEPLGLSTIDEFCEIDKPDLKFPPFRSEVPPAFAEESSDIFSVIKKRDRLLFVPYDSFSPVVDFVRQAAEDPNVLAIKQTLYRVGKDSPIVKALIEARRNGKQVTALVELKARFDEENNIVWAREMEQAGVHVVYGLVGLKTHAKLCLVVRREEEGIQQYVHIGTGNYNHITAKIYTDLGVFTADRRICDDVTDLFNAITGYAKKTEYRELLVAPASMREELIRRIDREIEAHRNTGEGYIAFKMNQLVDKACIKALYRAATAGVRIDLQVRGICCLRPGVPGVNDRIRVTSIVGRFLEHPRIYYFHNGGESEVIIGSADMMPRNLDRRIEVLTPIKDPDIAQMVYRKILLVHLQDTEKTRELTPEGRYRRIASAEGEEPLNAQEEMLRNWKQWRSSDKEQNGGSKGGKFRFSPFTLSNYL